MRRSGDYYDMEALAVHSFGAHDRGQDIHMQAAPSQVPNPLPARHPLLHALLPFPAAFRCTPDRRAPVYLAVNPSNFAACHYHECTSHNVSVQASAHCRIQRSP